MRGNASIKIGRFLYIMRRTRKLKKAVGVAAVVAMTATMLPVGVVTQNFGVSKIVHAEEQEQAKSKVLDTIWNNVEIGEHTGKGSYTYDSSAKTVVVTGAGTKFDKDNGNDNLSYSYFNAKGDVTITAKMKVSGSGNAQAGVLVRNDASEPGSQSEAIYADFGKNQIRYGRHGGKNGANSLGSAKAGDEVYVKIQIVGQVVSYYVSATSEFPEKPTKSETLSGIDTKTVGFFATEGATATFSDVKITSEYNQDDNKVKKVVFDSNVGELKATHTTSASYSGKYIEGNKYEEVADGNILKITQTRSKDDKGNIREDKHIDYLLFPEISENLTITADITVNSVDSGTDKQGIAIGQFSTKEKQKTSLDVVHFQKNKVYQHTYGNRGTGNCGDPKTSTLADAIGGTYTVSYSKKADNKAEVKIVSASGDVLVDTEANGATIDLAQDVIDSALQSGKSVNYGFAFSGISVDLANVKLINEAGEIVYDMNDYYIAVGVAPVINNATAKVADDRNSISVNWDIATEGTGNIKYQVYVSKDGADYVKAGDSKVNSYTYSVKEDGSYKFKVVPVGGDTKGTAIETTAVSLKTPLAKTILSAKGTDKSIELSWTAVEGATEYDIYKAFGSDGKAEIVKTVGDLSYTDSDIKAEEPYYYYIVAKNADNTSNPSETLQVLASNGHTGEYVYENEAAKLEVVAKDNDTVFADKASVAMKSDRAGTVKMVVNGNETIAKKVNADEAFILEASSLVKGRNDVEVLFKDETGKTTRKIFNFVSNPDYNIVVDSAFTGKDGDVVEGYATYKTVQAAINSVSEDNAESKVIFIKNGKYNERVTVMVPNVSLLGEDAQKTHIYYSAAVAEKTATGMWDRNAMYVDSKADGFTAENLTIENSYKYTNGNDQQADALCIVADKTACVNVRLVGYQDTLLTDSRVKGADGNYEVTRQYFSKCYITGNVDFIYGAGTSYFDDCDIVARYTEYKADGCFTAGRTYASTDYGYVFNNCRFLAEDKVADDSYRMARPWGKDDSTTFINCYLGRAIVDLGYGDMSGNSYKNARFAEYGSYGPGYVLDNDRPLLSSTQASAYTMNNVLGDYDASAVVKSLYKTDTPSTPDESEPVEPTPDSPKPSAPTLDTDVSIDTGKDAPSVEVKESVSDLIDNILSDDQKKDAEGKDVKIVLAVNKDIGVNEDDKKAAEKKLAELSSSKKAGMYLDIDLNVMIGNGNISVTETKKPIAIEVSVPDELINTDANKTRKYSVLRVHNGNVDVLDATYDENTKKILFKSDVFSTYVLVYEDTVKNQVPENPSPEDPTTEVPSTDEPATETPAGTEIKDGDKSVQTGDKSPIAALVSLLGLSGLGIFASTKKKRV